MQRNKKRSDGRRPLAEIGVNFGIDIPNFGDYSSPRTLAELAAEAEDAGWDGFFIFDHILSSVASIPVGDPWIALSAIAVRTTRIRIGPMVTPLPRRRPWKVAREATSLDILSGGRLILGVGLGGPPEREFERFGESGDMKARAKMLDESLDVLVGLWTGETFSYDGEHYTEREVTFLPRPLQSPRIPIWVGAKWRNRAPLRRAARWDGVFPIPHAGETITPESLKSVVSYVNAHRTSSHPLDVVLADQTEEREPHRAAESVVAYAEAGVTW